MTDHPAVACEHPETRRCYVGRRDFTVIECSECNLSLEVLAGDRTRPADPMEELYRDEHLLVTPHTGEDSNVALFVGQDPDEETPHIVDAARLADVLEEYADRFDDLEVEA